MPWTAAALSADLPAATAMPARCGAVEVALWRSASGAVRAWHDRCPHRGMRLSHGFVRGEMLNCIYHGWRYDGAGQCRKIPAHPALEPPATIRTNALAVIEAHGVIWLAEGLAEGLAERLADDRAETHTDGPEEAPPTLPENLVPLRSLTVDAPIDVVLGFFGAGHASVPITLPESDLSLLLQALPATRTVASRTTLHALTTAADVARARAASRKLDALRRAIEMMEAA